MPLAERDSLEDDLVWGANLRFMYDEVDVSRIAKGAAAPE